MIADEEKNVRILANTTWRDGWTDAFLGLRRILTDATEAEIPWLEISDFVLIGQGNMEKIVGSISRRL